MPLREMKTLRLFVLVASIFLHTPNDVIQQVTFQGYHLISVYSVIQSCPQTEILPFVPHLLKCSLAYVILAMSLYVIQNN
jgi:hypothetical protein